MSRRKQARPIKHLEEDGSISVGLAGPLPPTPTLQQPTHGESSASCSEEDVSCAVTDEVETMPLMCPRCQEQFTEVPEFLTHKQACEQKAQRHQDTAHSDPEDMVVSEYEDEDDSDEGKRLEAARRHRQDAANNNSVEEGEGGEVRLGFPFPSASHVTLEALQNTKVAVAQFAATAMANNADNEAALQELAVLQSTLFTLQHQQVFQLQLINQLQQQLSLNRSKESSPPSPAAPDVAPGPASPVPPAPHPAQSPSPSPGPLIAGVDPVPAGDSTTPATLTPPPIPTSQPLAQSQSQQPQQALQVNVHQQPPLCSISSSLAASIITNNDPPPSLDEPNTLEMLQKRAQEVLDNASQGLLANNLADELAFRKSKGSMSPYDGKSGRNEPFFKHRCRYCGKVFGSDSALQIHIRSHTGERPFKCNVCGSRFTTKGNLKVHFQRHTQKFPHIKMNPNPVPEHLDKYHPPLLAQMGQQAALSPGGPVHHPPHPFPSAHPFPQASIPIYRPSIPPPPDMLQGRLQPSPQRPELGGGRALPPHPLFMKREEQDVPADLSKPARSPPPATTAPDTRLKTEPLGLDDKRDDEHKASPPILNNTFTPKQEMEIDNDVPEHENEHERYPSPPPYDECSMDSKYSNEDLLGRRSPMEHMQEEPENLSNKTNSITAPLSIATGQRLPASFNFPHASSPPSSTSSGSLGPFSTQSGTDPARDPAVYTSLLPRPGSNDNSWESLIEVTKTSETSKLQQLVDNIEHKLTDPNQCVICHRVLSCKSALQMHYRTHTGERPFKCKICGRAFTTKGNLKTHMGVHRAKPPMRVLHQCPVCHKKFTNALVLQQHIRLHTGEPTDLTPEQIQAAEIKDFPSPGAGPFPSLPNSINPFLAGQNFTVPSLASLNAANLPLNMKHDAEMRSESEFPEEDEDDDDDMSVGEQHLPSFSTSLAALENQVRTITTMASQMSANTSNCSPEDLCSTRPATTTPTPQNGDKSPTQSGIMSPNGSEIPCSPNHMPVQIPRPPSSQQAGSPTPSESNSLGALDLTPRASQPPAPSPGPPHMFSNFGLLPPSQGSSPLMSSALSSLTSSVLTSTAFSPLGLAVGPAGAFAPIRGNTTCNICFKTFACNSALEIHYRSHTKERPFKCTVCDRGFSTKGNMKQHMLTHKIRDMPQHMFDKPIVSTSSIDEQPLRELPPPVPSEPEPVLPPPSVEPLIKQEIVSAAVKRATDAAELPVPKRPPNVQSSKHLCHVCNKNFSSSSALQIHMRTHTGDKPFRCTVCQKAFTTKGNLKVHMGTHMWSNGASRRGRRMSLDLPPIPMTPKDSEFLQRRPDLFYPYLPAPFLNGMQQKLNEISVIQNANNGLASSGKYTGLLGFGYPPPESARAPADSPLAVKSEASESPGAEREAPPRVWDLHYERKSAEPTLEGSGLQPPPRGEGLAA